MLDDGDWQILADGDRAGKRPEEIIEIISALTAALDERQVRKPHAPLSSNGT